MTLLSFLYISLAVVLGTAAQLLLKAGTNATPVGIAYPMVSLGFALNAGLAWWLLGEAVTPMRMAGIGIIIVGVVLVARS